jgi:hypothetical protein
LIEPYEGDLNANDINDFASVHTLPLVLELNDATMFNILSNPITAHLVVIAPAVCSYLTVVWLD